MINPKKILLALCLGVMGFQSVFAQSQSLKVLILSGQNNHDWKKSTPFLKRILDEAQHIEADVLLSPPKGAPAEAWQDWNPPFEDYDCLVLDYNGDAWPSAVQTSFVNYISNGGGAIVIHAANNSFNGWKEYEAMVGMLWRGTDFGDSLYFDEDGNIVREKPGKGRGMGHGGQYDWMMTTRDTQNPITRGMPLHWQHVKDELYHGQRGPAKNMNILLSAYSDPDNGGTGKEEPIVWWIPWGEGRVLTNVMGHVGDTAPMECVGFQVLMLRSIEWLATGGCTTPLPGNFPTSREIRREVPQH